MDMAGSTLSTGVTLVNGVDALGRGMVQMKNWRKRTQLAYNYEDGSDHDNDISDGIASPIFWSK